MHTPIATRAAVLLVLITGLMPPAFARALCGDANDSGDITLSDGVHTLRNAVGLTSACTSARCDVDESGSVTLSDGVLILRAAAQLPAVLHCTGPSPHCGDGVLNDASEACDEPDDDACPGRCTETCQCAPTPTLTPATTTSPTPSTVTVKFTVGSNSNIQSFRFRVEYPVAKGGFRGSADGVACTSAAPGFIGNDQDDGNMLLVSISSVPLTLPVDISCTFDTSGSPLLVGDIGIVRLSVTENNQIVNDPDAEKLSVSVAIL